MTDLSHIDHLSRVTGPSAHPANDADPQGCWLRWCFASRDPRRLVAGVDRLRVWLSA